MSIYSPFLFPYHIYTPWLPNDCDKPPTIYSLLESIVNYGKDDKEKIKDLAKYGRTTFFNFQYPLSTKVNKEDFECMILNHFLMRRIGFDTLTSFRIQLNVKLNEIMPMYNKLFDSVDGWDLFEDGEKVERETNFDGTTNNTSKTNTEETKNGTTTNKNNTSNTLNNNSNSQNTNIIDRRNSELPQSEIDNVKNASYLTDYTYENNSSNGTDNSESTGTSESTNNGTTQDTMTGETNGISNTTDVNKTTETIKRTPNDKIRIYTEFLQNKQNIYTMIFKDLDCLFYQLI